MKLGTSVYMALTDTIVAMALRTMFVLATLLVDSSEMLRVRQVLRMQGISW